MDQYTLIRNTTPSCFGFGGVFVCFVCLCLFALFVLLVCYFFFFFLGGGGIICPIKRTLGLSFKEMSVVFFADLLTSKVNIQ